MRTTRSISFALAAAGLLLSLSMPAAEYQWRLPRGFPEPAVPLDNPMSEAKVALGQRLFFDPQLSLTGSYSCASCHAPERSFSDGRRVAVGALGDSLELNAMALVNIAYNVSYGWMNPEARSLEAQMLEPLLNEHPVEMGVKGRETELIQRLCADSSYREQFAAAFPNEPTMSFDQLVKAIAAFERTLIFGRSAFDRYVFEGDHTALSSEAKRGMQLFFSSQSGCSNCHSGFNFAGNWRDAHGPTGAPSFARNGTTDQPLRVPTLRNLVATAPYMHDGRFEDLGAVIDHYAQSDGSQTPKLQLTKQQRRELVGFLRSLTGQKVDQVAR